MAKGFAKSMKAELKKVVWPTKEQVIKNTTMVVALVVVVAAVVLGVDLILKTLDTQLWSFIEQLIK
ncbi:MAG: preprotein translocase subunit SecE [Clostridia bacterium]